MKQENFKFSFLGVEQMVTKEQLKTHFEKKGEIPKIILDMIDETPEDERGIYSLAGEFLGRRDYLLLEQVVSDFKKSLDARITGLIKIRQFCNDVYSDGKAPFQACLIDYIKSGSVDFVIANEKPRDGFSLD
jgi:hypothetical protein